jgi:hypothetical protein
MSKEPQKTLAGMAISSGIVLLIITIVFGVLGVDEASERWAGLMNGTLSLSEYLPGNGVYAIVGILGTIALITVGYINYKRSKA